MNTQNSAVSNKRKEKDVTKLMLSDFDVKLVDENSFNEFIVKFDGPQDSPYEGGQWNVRVLLPDNYPYKSPSIGFQNKIMHPNIDEQSGSVCLDVINQTWSPMYDLFNIFTIFLPQLLLYPNPTDPLNSEAAALQMKDEKKYKEKIQEYVKKYALSQNSQSNKHNKPVVEPKSNSQNDHQNYPTTNSQQDNHKLNGTTQNGHQSNGDDVEENSDKLSETSIPDIDDDSNEDSDGDKEMTEEVKSNHTDEEESKTQ